jgi:hypothetical protein
MYREHEEEKSTWFAAVALTIQKPADQADGEAEDRTRNRDRNGLPRSGHSRIGIDPHLVLRGIEPEHIRDTRVRRFMRSHIQCESSHEEQRWTDRDAALPGLSYAYRTGNYSCVTWAGSRHLLQLIPHVRRHITYLGQDALQLFT